VETLQRICRKKNEICLVVWFVCPVLEKKQKESPILINSFGRRGIINFSDNNILIKNK
jgi:hypothetical protein